MAKPMWAHVFWDLVPRSGSSCHVPKGLTICYNVVKFQVSTENSGRKKPESPFFPTFQGQPLTLNQDRRHHVICPCKGLAIFYNMVKVSRFYCNSCPRNIQKSIFPHFKGHPVTLNQGQGRHVICRCKGLVICYTMVKVPWLDCN